MKRLLIVLVSVVLLLVATFLTLSWRSAQLLREVHTVTVSVPELPTGDEAIDWGRHIASTRGCMDCHGADLGGATVIDDFAMGRIDGPNLTRGVGGVGADRSDIDWVRAIRHGLARDGHGLFLMPSDDYAPFSDRDLGSLLVFLRSLPPVDRTMEPIQLGPMARILLATGGIRLAYDKIDHANLRPSTVTPGPSVAYGRYLATACSGCHGSNFGGGKIPGGAPDWPPAANLTAGAPDSPPHWTEAQFAAAMRQGVRPDGSALSPVMPRSFGGMSDDELRALWLYFQTLPPVKPSS